MGDDYLLVSQCAPPGETYTDRGMVSEQRDAPALSNEIACTMRSGQYLEYKVRRITIECGDCILTYGSCCTCFTPPPDQNVL